MKFYWGIKLLIFCLLHTGELRNGLASLESFDFYFWDVKEEGKIKNIFYLSHPFWRMNNKYGTNEYCIDREGILKDTQMEEPNSKKNSKKPSFLLDRGDIVSCRFCFFKV